MRLRKAKGILVALAVAAIAFQGGTAAQAAQVSADFDSYTTGTINGQDGWSSFGSIGAGGGCISPGYDHQVVANAGQPWSYPSFGSKSLRISNAYTSGCFGDQTFSKPTNEAGETTAEAGGMSAGPRDKFFAAQWAFASTTPVHQSNLIVVASPDRGDGARMSWVSMEDQPAGLAVKFYDYQSGVNEVGCVNGDNFIQSTVASGLSRTAVHTIRIEMDFVDGAANDVVRVYVDGTLGHTGTSWEDYFRECEGNPSRTVDSILFRTGGAGGLTNPAVLGKGVLIDGLQVASSSSAPSPFTPRITFPEFAGGYQTTSLTVTGRGVPGTSVRLVLGDPPCANSDCFANPTLAGPLTVDLFGDWSVPVTLPEGQHRIYMFWDNGTGERIVDVVDFYLDVTLPAAPTIDFPTGVETFTSSVVPITGQAEPGAFVVVTDELGNVRTTTAEDDGTWSYNGIFRAGTHTIFAYQQDRARNTSASSASVSFDVDVDETAPAVPTIISPAPFTGDPIGPNVTVTGLAEPLSSVEIFEAQPSGFIVHATVNTAANGSFSANLTLADGLHFLQARATDTAGNRGPATAIRRVQVDATPPVVKIRRGDMWVLAELKFNGDTMSGPVSDAVGLNTVKIRYQNSLTGQVVERFASCPCTGLRSEWTDEVSGLLPGLWSVRVTATDRVGNSATATHTIFVVV